MKTLRLVLGDQLNIKHSWFRKVDPEVTYVLMEIRSETDYVTHHIQKVVAFFLAMRKFARELEERGHNVIYLRLDDSRNRQSFSKNLSELVREKRFQRFQYQYPDEYRLDQELKKFCEEQQVECGAVDTEHFLTERFFVREFFRGKKEYLMESFYREMRRRTGILMDSSGKPLGGKWNFDAENRKKLPKGASVPAPLIFSHDTAKIIVTLKEQGVRTIGSCDRFSWPISREESVKLLRYFLKHLLPSFGEYQDALSVRERFLYHSRLSFSLNSKLLSPLEVVQAAVKEWERREHEISLSQVEGFIRQIIGWREYMRGIYWDKMPAFAGENFFGHTASLPEFYWSGKTKMNCLSHAVTQSLEEAYAHHIQRLMVTGNFALLAGVDPRFVDEWYLGIYIDAIEWVELPNTRGMSQFADGGVVATKPYVSSANYINKMSDYCGGCHYDHKKRSGEGSCPFNSMYWEFLNRHRDKLEGNPRMGMVYRVLEKIDEREREEIFKTARGYRESLSQL
jgi:deoxyribodipyrimidine photolyase-related protein